MKRLKTNGVIAILLGAGILAGSIGHVEGLEDEKVYKAPDLLLTQGQDEYNLCDGIKYNSEKYEFSIYDEGGFDINAPGSYTVTYVLTPAEVKAEPKEPAEPEKAFLSLVDFDEAVKRMVQYQNARFDINTESDPLTGMDYESGSQLRITS